MDRCSTSPSEYFAAMRVGRLGAIQLLLFAAVGKRAEPVVAALAGRVLHALAVLRQPPSGGLITAPCGLRYQPQTCAAAHGHSGLSSHLSATALVPASTGPSDLSVSAARRCHPDCQSSLEQRRYL